jgi:hypothetical protein
MTLASHPIRGKTTLTHRRVPAAEEFGLHAAILLLVLATVLIKVAA